MINIRSPNSIFYDYVTAFAYSHTRQGKREWEGIFIISLYQRLMFHSPCILHLPAHKYSCAHLIIICDLIDPALKIQQFM